MATIQVDGDPENVIDLVEKHGGFPHGIATTTEHEVDASREMLGRLLDTLAEKHLLSDNELRIIIRGY